MGKRRRLLTVSDVDTGGLAGARGQAAPGLNSPAVVAPRISRSDPAPRASRDFAGRDSIAQTTCSSALKTSAADVRVLCEARPPVDGPAVGLCANEEGGGRSPVQPRNEEGGVGFAAKTELNDKAENALDQGVRESDAGLITLEEALNRLAAINLRQMRITYKWDAQVFPGSGFVRMRASKRHARVRACAHTPYVNEAPCHVIGWIRACARAG
jgi:hypothetical protein